MPGSTDRPPDLVQELRAMKARLAEIEGRMLNRIVAAARVTTVGTTTIPNNGGIVDFTSASIDTAGLWDAGEPSRLTIPIAGVYAVAGQARVEFNATGLRGLTLQLNGADVIDSEMRVDAASSTTYTALIAYALLECQVGDYLELEVSQTSGGDLDATPATLSAHWVGVLT